jgi:hypothetical protein
MFFSEKEFANDIFVGYVSNKYIFKMTEEESLIVHVKSSGVGNSNDSNSYYGKFKNISSF